MWKANRPYKLRALRLLIEGTQQGAIVPDLRRRMTARQIMTEKTNPSGQPFVNDYVAVLRMSRTFNQELILSFISFISDFVNVIRDYGLAGDGARRSQVRLSLSELLKVSYF